MALRYIAKAPGMQAVKVVSMTLGLAVGLVIFAKVAFDRSYDNFLPDKGRVYLLTGDAIMNMGQGEQTGRFVHLWGPMAPHIKDNLPTVESATRMITWMSNDFFYEDRPFKFEEMFADKNLFDVLDYGMVQGDAAALDEADAILVSKSAAKAMFGNDDPIGKVIMVDKANPVVVRGVFKDIPVNSTLQFDVVLSIKALTQGGMYADSWDQSDAYRTYVKLREGASEEQVTEDIQALMEVSPLATIFERLKMKFRLWAIDDIKGGDSPTLLLGLAFLVLFIAAMNYVLVAISSLEKRTKSIAMQKCNGATTGGIFGEFLIETALLIVLSLALALMLLLGFDTQIHMLTGQGMEALFAPGQWLKIGAVVLGFFVLAGVIPGRIFSRIPVAHAFKTMKAGKRWWKQALVMVQLMCATFVVIFLILVVRQYNLISGRDLGYEHENLVGLEIRGVDAVGYERIRAGLSTLPVVEETAFTDIYLIDGLSGEKIKFPNSEEVLSSRRIIAEPGLLSTIGVEMVYGEDFPQDGYRQEQVIVNETLLRTLGIEPSTAVGMRLEGEEELEIVGVVKDFHTGWNPMGPINPLIIFSPADIVEEDGEPIYLHMRLTKLNAENLERLKVELEKLLPNQTVELHPYSEFIRDSIGNERMVRNVVMMAAAIILVITLTGLVGYLNDEVRRRRREIAIRKINGATVRQIIEMVAGSLLVVGAVALVSGMAGAWFGGVKFLENFPMKVTLGVGGMVAGAAFVATVVLATVVARSWKAANENPNKTIKSE